MTTTQRPLPPDAIAGLSSIAEACDVLRAWGHPDLADRLAYFASDENLEDGDERLTLESAQGFLAFFGAVESIDGDVSLTCSPEGWILSVWRFPDGRRVSLWFVNADTVMYAARKSDGRFVALLNDGSETGDRTLVTEKLLDSGEWFTRNTSHDATTARPSGTLARSSRSQVLPSS